MSAQPKERALPSGKMDELRRRFDPAAHASVAAADRSAPQPLPVELGLAFGPARARPRPVPVESKQQQQQQPQEQRVRATMAPSSAVAITSAGSRSNRSSVPVATSSSHVSPPPQLWPSPRAGDRGRPAPAPGKPHPGPTNGTAVGGIAPRTSAAAAATAAAVPAARELPSSAVKANGRLPAAGDSLYLARVAQVRENEPISQRGCVSGVRLVGPQLRLRQQHGISEATGSAGNSEVGHGSTAVDRVGSSAGGIGSSSSSSVVAHSRDPLDPAAAMPRAADGRARLLSVGTPRRDPWPGLGEPAARCPPDCDSGKAYGASCAASGAADAALASSRRPRSGDTSSISNDGAGCSLPESADRTGCIAAADTVGGGDADDAGDSSGVAASAGKDDVGGSQPPPSGTCSMAAAVAAKPPPPPKPPRTFEHDIYVQSKVTGRQPPAAAPGAQQTAAAPGAAAARPRICLHHYEEIDVGQLTTTRAATTSAEAWGALDAAPVYESLGPISLPSANLQPGVGVATSSDDTPAAADKPPPLPARPPPMLDAPVPSGPGRGNSEAVGRGSALHPDKVRSPTNSGLGPKHGFLKALLLRRHQPQRRQKKDTLKRYASAECITAAVAAGGEQVFVMPQLSPEASPAFGSSLRGAHDSAGSSSQVFNFPEPVHYASSMLISAQTLTRSSSHGNLSADASELSQHHLLRVTISGTDDSLAEPPAAASGSTRQLASKKHSVRRDKVTMKLHNAFSLLGQAGRRMRSASTDEGSALALSVASEDSRDILQRRLQHCSTVRESSVYASPSKIRETINNRYPQLFSYALVVGLQSVPVSHTDAHETSDDGVVSKRNVPYVKYKFPGQVDVESLHVPLFCFPDVDNWQDRNMQRVETYSFVLTSSDGSRLYGYCKRYTLTHVVDGQQVVKPEVVCVTSPLSAAKFFSEILDEFVLRRKASPQRAEEFLEAAYGKPLPRPGSAISFRAVDDSEQSEVVTFARAVDSRIEDASCGCLLQVLSARQIVSVFAALLNERKVVLCAEMPSTLSPCIGALVSLLYPFSWQHTLVPVLPPSLVDVVCSPTPFVVGVLTSCLQQLGDLDADEVLIVNLDTQKVVSAVGDEHSILPKKLSKALQSALDMSKSESKYQDTMISEAFLYFFFESLGSLDDYVVVSEGGKRDFQKDRFVRAAENTATADFVKWFSQTQMFDAYVVEKCEGYSSSKAGDYEDRFIAWLQDPVTSSERTPVKALFRNLFYKAKPKK